MPVNVSNGSAECVAQRDPTRTKQFVLCNRVALAIGCAPDSREPRRRASDYGDHGHRKAQERRCVETRARSRTKSLCWTSAWMARRAETEEMGEVVTPAPVQRTNQSARAASTGVPRLHLADAEGET